MNTRCVFIYLCCLSFLQQTFVIFTAQIFCLTGLVNFFKYFSLSDAFANGFTWKLIFLACFGHINTNLLNIFWGFLFQQSSRETVMWFSFVEVPEYSVWKYSTPSIIWKSFRRIVIYSSLNIWQNSPGKPFSPGFYFIGNFFCFSKP